LLAGYAGGLAYGTTMRTQGWLYAAADVVRRAWTLYIAHIFLFVLFTAQVTYSATALNRLNYLSETRLDVLGDDPYRSMLEALLLRFQPSLLNILPLYVVLLVFFAATIWMLRWPRLLFAFSFAIYLLVRVSGVNLDVWDGGGWFFDPLAWQFLFVIGVLLACAPMRAPRWPWVLDAAAVVAVVVGVVLTMVIEPQPHRLAWVSASAFRSLVVEDKTGLYPLRLISILSLTWLCVRLIRFDAGWLRSRWAAPLVLIGQNSLPVFCSGIVIGFVARLGLEYDDQAAMQVGINLFGVAGMLGVGALAAWYRVKGKPRASRTAPSMSPNLLPVNAQADTG
jgi:hypothetical protein